MCGVMKFFEEKKRLVAKGKIRALISEDGSVEWLEIGDKLFEGFEDFVPIPRKDLRYVRIGEIPQGVLIEPVERVENNTVYMTKIGKKFFFDAKFGRDGVYLELDEWISDWDSYIGLAAYIDALEFVLDIFDKWGFIDNPMIDFAGDMYSVSFFVPLPEEITILKSLKFVKKLIREIERTVEFIAVLLVLEEVNNVIEKRKQFDLDELINRINNLYERYGL